MRRPSSKAVLIQKTETVAALEPIDISILKMCAAGNTLYEIGQGINRSERTVEHRIEKLRKALGARSKTHLVVMILKQGAIKLSDIN